MIGTDDDLPPATTPSRKPLYRRPYPWITVAAVIGIGAAATAIGGGSASPGRRPPSHRLPPRHRPASSRGNRLLPPPPGRGPKRASPPAGRARSQPSSQGAGGLDRCRTAGGRSLRS